MIWYKTVLVWSRLGIFDSGQNKNSSTFAAGLYEVPREVSLSGFDIWMINEDFHIAGI